MLQVTRRQLVRLLAGAAVAWPLVARAQQTVMPKVGFLRSATLADVSNWVGAFRQGLKEAGFIEGQHVAIEYRSADNHPDRLPALVTDLIRQPVAVIVANTDSALAAKAATATIPIVFVGGSDPVKLGLVASLNRPGGNVTGVAYFAGVLGAKRLELLRQVVPRAAVIAMLVNPTIPSTRPSEKTCRPRRRRSGSNSSFRMSAASVILRPHLQPSPNTAPVRCSSVPAGFSTPIGSESSRWRFGISCRRAIASARAP
jgi:putative ABC transport system substrate-binding protein